MSPGAVKRCLSAYVDAVNAHDVTRMLADRHPQATLSFMGTPVTIASRAALDHFYRRFFATAPGYRLNIEDGLFADDLGVVWGTVIDAAVASGSDTGTAEVPAAFVCTFEDGQFRHDRMYTDFARLNALFGLVA